MNDPCVGPAPTIVAEHLTKVFGRFRAVDGVSFEVWPGEIFGLLGPNGAGKTTTIRMLLGLLQPTAGRVTILGTDVVRHPRQVRQCIGYMSQRFTLYNDLTVAQNLAFFGGVYGLRGEQLRQRVAAALEMAELVGREAELTRNLSGGSRQRLALGCAILHEPRVVFLDEPTAGVDPVARRAFWDLLYTLSEQGRTVLVTTHYMDEAEQCHRLAFVQRGTIVALGAPEEIKRQYMPGRVIEITCDAPERAVPALRRCEALGEVALYGAQVHVISPDAAAARGLIREILEREGIRVLTLQEISPSLEDVFVASVKQHVEREESAA